VENYLHQMEIDGQGNIILAGYDYNQYNAPDSVDFVVRRLDANGAPDLTFAQGTSVSVDFAHGSDIVNKLMVSSDGDIIVSGLVEKTPGSGDYELGIVRIDSDGTLDAGFGTGGRWTSADDTVVDANFDVFMDDQERLIVYGYQFDANGPGAVSINRYLQDGSLDTSFGEGGRVWLGLTANNLGAISVASGPDGELVVGWTHHYYYQGTSSMETRIVRLDEDGARDTAFGVDGTAIITRPMMFNSLQLEVDAGGGVLMGFGGTATDSPLSVGRLDAYGKIDLSFGNDGYAGVAGASQVVELSGFHVDGDGDIVLAGRSVYGYGAVTVGSLHSDGSIDTGFGVGVDVFASGSLWAADAENGWWTLGWTGDAAGNYGSFHIDESGSWTYDLDETSYAVNSLPLGQTLTDTFTATVTDPNGASTAQQVVITIVGTYEAGTP
jgi:uncharacterized delta-60 repeat protein